MGAYETVDREPRWYVRVYCEKLIDDERYAIEVGGVTQYIAPDEAIRMATALLNAAARVKHQLKVDAVLKGTT